MEPYSNNIIFLDAEFTQLDPKVGELLSLGLVKYTGEELYLELEYEGKFIHPWVEKHVLPSLKGKAINRKTAQKILWQFIGKNKKEKDKPYMMAYVNQFDAIYWYDLFAGPKSHPFFWIPIDFASILFASGYDPNSLGKHKFFAELGIDKNKYNEHNALEDARMLRDIYLKFNDILVTK